VTACPAEREMPDVLAETFARTIEEARANSPDVVGSG
jgi:hypothetical protein